MKKVLTIAGSDCSGGAGIQADLKTITVYGMYGMSAITALTAQNTTGVYGIHKCPADFLEQQLSCVLEDIFPDAVKIGMLADQELIHVAAGKLSEYQVQNVVLDPVMVSTSGRSLLAESAVAALIEKLFPLTNLITPNIPEAEQLSGYGIMTEEDMVKAAERISRFYQGSILVKGGHQEKTANDLLYENGKVTWFYGERIENPNTHGTGCTLSSAIACGLAEGKSITESIRKAKKYLTGAMKDKMNLGQGNGPLNHGYGLYSKK